MDKYITLANNNKYKNNTNSEFLCDVPLFDIKNKCKISINEITYTNNIKINLENIELKIITHTKDTIEFIDHIKFIENFRNITKSIYRDIINNLDNIILDNDDNAEYEYLLYILDDKAKSNIETNEKLLKNNLSRLYQNFVDINNHLQKYNTFNFDYYISNELDYVRDIKNFIELAKINKEIKNYFYKLDFPTLISKFYSLIKSLKSKFIIKSKFEVFDKWTTDEFYQYVIDIFKLQIQSKLIVITQKSNYISIIIDKYKYLFNRSNICSKLFNIKIESNAIIFEVRNKINYIKSLNVYTDIIEANDIFNSKEKILQIIKTEGDYLETVIKNFVRPSYSVVNRTFINSIYIKILDQNNNTISFEHPVSIKLHFLSK